MAGDTGRKGTRNNPNQVNGRRSAPDTSSQPVSGIASSSRYRRVWLRCAAPFCHGGTEPGRRGAGCASRQPIRTSVSTTTVSPIALCAGISARSAGTGPRSSPIDRLATTSAAMIQCSHIATRV